MARGSDGFRRLAARRLRAHATETERCLRRELRRIPIQGTHFRRQVELGPFIVDFACHAARLIIEVDGGQHADDGAARRDLTRTRWLESQGYRVLRFWNADVARNMPAVLDAIYAALHGSISAEPRTFSPTSARFVRRPSTQGGG